MKVWVVGVRNTKQRFLPLVRVFQTKRAACDWLLARWPHLREFLCEALECGGTSHGTREPNGFRVVLREQEVLP